MHHFHAADLICIFPFALLLAAFFYNLYCKWHRLQVSGKLERPREQPDPTWLDYVLYSLLRLYQEGNRILAFTRDFASASSPSPEVRSEPIDSSLLDALSNALHLLVIGPSRSGKTTIVHALALRWQSTNRVIVCDPDAAPGLWEGCEVSGAGDDYAAIEQTLATLSDEIATRSRQRALGARQFSPLRVILCEYADIARFCPGARSLIEMCLRRGGKLGCSLVLDVQDKQRRTLGLDGATHLLQNFSHICEVRKGGPLKRTATITVYGDEEQAATYDVPILPDLEALIRIESNRLPFSPGSLPDSPGVESSSPQTTEEKAMRYLLQLFGTKDGVAAFLGGRKTTAYKRINQALGEDKEH